jgi:hypothetical protein
MVTEVGTSRFAKPAFRRHPGLDPGSMNSARETRSHSASWILTFVRMTEIGTSDLPNRLQSALTRVWNITRTWCGEKAKDHGNPCTHAGDPAEVNFFP